MHARRFACFVLGLWLGGGLLVAWLTWVNQQVADHLVNDANPAARLELRALGPNSRAVLRYQASEEGRRYYQVWESAQIILGFAFFTLMLFGSRENKYLLAGILVLILLVVFERTLVTPALTAQGRLVDFAPPDAAAAERKGYWVLQTGYLAIEGVKWLFIVALAGQMVFSRQGSGRSRDSRRKLDEINKPNYSRVNW